MRTTLNLEDDALLVAKRYAGREKLSLSEAVSRLVRQAAQRPAEPPKGVGRPSTLRRDQRQRVINAIATLRAQRLELDGTLKDWLARPTDRHA
jgi:hypothetical protein